MQALVLGGTGFLGRHIVDCLVDQGVHVTLLNRGETDPNLFPDLKTIIGNRNQSLEHADGSYDVVIDTNGFFPRQLDRTVKLWHDALYVFISTYSIYDYKKGQPEPIAEDGELVDLFIDPSDKDPSTYGARKYLSEEIVRKNRPQNLILRPGLVAGPYDWHYRFPYWADRIAEGESVLCPSPYEAPLQFIDARDLALFLAHGLKNNLRGEYNLSLPPQDLTLGRFIEAVQREVNPECRLKWVSEEFIRSYGVQCWTQLPLWVYQEQIGFMNVDSSKALEAGLKFRPIEETIRDTRDWSRSVYREQYLKKVLSRELEAKILREYHEK